VTGETDPKKVAQTKDRAWRRALEKIPDTYVLRQHDGREWLWLKA
jgi:hypothetical protein